MLQENLNRANEIKSDVKALNGNESNINQGISRCEGLIDDKDSFIGITINGGSRPGINIALSPEDLLFFLQGALKKSERHRQSLEKEFEKL